MYHLDQQKPKPLDEIHIFNASLIYSLQDCGLQAYCVAPEIKFLVTFEFQSCEKTFETTKPFTATFIDACHWIEKLQRRFKSEKRP